MKTFKNHDEIFDYLIRKDKPFNFVRVTIQLMTADEKKKAFAEMEVLAAYSFTEMMYKVENNRICLDGIPLFNLWGYPLSKEHLS